MYWIGTSGYDYPEWRGAFYPEDLPASKRLPYYASQFASVEINYTFYHLPTEKTLAGWLSQTPASFKLTLKAPKRITHVARLQDSGELVSRFCELAARLEDKLGALLFQLPPFLRKDLGLLDRFAATLPPGARAAIEFRHPSWLSDEVYATLREHDIALCVADSEKLRTPAIRTASFAYFRLRDEGYTPGDLAQWAEAIRAAGAEAQDVFVYFKHEEAGKGTEFARIVLERLGQSHGPATSRV